LAAHDFLSLVRNKQLDSLESAWTDAVANPDSSIDVYVQTIRELCDSDELGTAMKLCSAMVEALAALDRVADASRLGLELVEKDAHNESFARSLFELLERQHSAEPWYPLALELSGLSAERASGQTLLAFDRARRFTPGHVVYHRSGWGEGLVESLDVDQRTIRVEFSSGTTKELPLASAVDTLRPLDDDDLRAMRICRAEELQELAAKRPAELVRLAARMYRGEINSQQLKSELSPSVVPTKSWASFWKRAKTATANDPWLKVEGSKTRPVFVLRKQPLSLAAEAETAMNHAHDLTGVVEVCREYLARGLDDSAQSTILDLAQKRTEDELAKNTDSAEHLLDAMLFLEEHGRSTSVPAGQELATLLRGTVGFEPEAIDRLRTQASREHAARLLPEALGENWADLCVDSLMRFPSSVIEVVIDQLTEAGHGPRLTSAWAAVAPYPRKFPVLTYLLGRLFADGVFEGHPEAPDRIGVGRVLLHLTRIVNKERKADAEMSRIRARLTSLLVGRKGFLLSCLDGIGRDDLATYLGICERGGSDFPHEITDSVLRAVARMHPDITTRPERPFWEVDDYVYVTADGFRRHKEQHRVLVDLKIPENAKAIQHAAGYGDLSENAEWEAAMEEQRNLTGRAEEMSRDLRRVRLIEDQEIPDGVVAPGTRVTFTYLDNAEQHTYRILGPWDCVAEDIVNYRAPLAAALLGQRVGDQTVVETVDGSHPVRIDAIERIVGV
jgi:transcription elongation factor GreA